MNYGGVELHPEGGRFRYDAQPMSVYFKSQSTHNTVLFLADAFDPDAPTELIRSESTEGHDITVVRRKEQRGSTWQRAVVHDRSSRALVVADHVRPHTLSDVIQLWQLPAGAVVRVRNHRAHIFLRGKHLATLATAASSPVYYETVEGRRSADHIEGWRSVKYGEFFAAPVLRIGIHTAEALIATAILPDWLIHSDAEIDLGESVQLTTARLRIKCERSASTVRIRVVDCNLTAHVFHETISA